MTLLPNGVATYNLKRQTIKASVTDDISIAIIGEQDSLFVMPNPCLPLRKTIERMYNVKININDAKLRNMKFTGTIQNNSLTNVLYVMSLSYPLTYTVTDSVITVSAQKNIIKKHR